MSESDKSGKPELDAHECEHFLMTDVAVYACDCDNIQIVDVKDGYTTEYVPKGQPDERSAAQARIAELEAISKALIKTLQVSLPIVSAPLRETFEIAIAKAKDKLLKP